MVVSGFSCVYLSIPKKEKMLCKYILICIITAYNNFTITSILYNFIVKILLNIKFIFFID